MEFIENTMQILSDHPIKTGKDDKLSRSIFASKIAEGILKWDSNESLCMALYGAWGSGKTSVINMCLEEIKERTKDWKREQAPIILTFRPWIISGQENLVSIFLKQLRVALQRPDLSEHAKKAAKNIELYEKVFDFASWIPVVKGPATVIKTVLGKMKSAANMAAEHLEHDLEGNKKAICEALEKLPARILIIIDDVDRLTNDEMRQLFQLIKAVADFPRTIYLLAYDQNRVEKALEAFHEGSDASYMEKIVQVAFDIPNPSSSQVASILWDGLEFIVKTISTDKDEQKRWNEIRFGPLLKLFRNVRDVKRYLNAVHFMFQIVKDEVSSVDVLGIEAIHFLAPKLYHAIRQNKDLITSDSTRARAYRERDEEKEKWIRSVPDLAPEPTKLYFKELLTHLFPEVYSVFRNTNFGSDFKTGWDNQKRVCMTNYFDFYFQCSLPEGEVSQAEVNRVIGLLDDLDGLALILKNYVEDNRLRNLLPKIEAHFEKASQEQSIRNLIAALFRTGEEAPLRPDGLFFTAELPFDWLVSGTVYRLLKKIDEGKRWPLLKDAISDTPNAVFFPVYMAAQIWRQWHPIKKDESTKENDKLFSEADTAALKDEAVNLIGRQKDTALFKTHRLLGILYDWIRWTSEAEVKKWAESILSDERKIARFLRGCAGYSGSAGMESNFASYNLQIPVKHLGTFCDVDKLKLKAKDLVMNSPDWLVKEDKEVLEIFLRDYEKKDAGPLDD